MDLIFILLSSQIIGCIAVNGSQPTWVADGYCDDNNNNMGCNYDGGDCCGPDVNTDYCQECICIDDSVTHAPTSSNARTTGQTNTGTWSTERGIYQVGGTILIEARNTLIS